MNLMVSVIAEKSYNDGLPVGEDREEDAPYDLDEKTPLLHEAHISSL
jgi:CTD nuclear envelope phosphatase 1